MEPVGCGTAKKTHKNLWGHAKPIIFILLKWILKNLLRGGRSNAAAKNRGIKMPTDVKELLLENEFLTNQNANYRSYCEELAMYCLPRKSWINSMRTHGERVKFNFLYDSTAIRALRICAAGFFSYLTNPSARWFGFELRDKDLGETKKEIAHKILEQKIFI